MFTMTNFAKRGRLSISWRACVLLVGLCCPFPVVSSYATDSITEIQQNKTKKFRGNVLDEAGAPVTGATVQIQGKAGGVITDIDGNFTIEVGESDVLQITFIGLETQLVPVRGKASMKIVMKELRDELEEVTVVAFAKQKKESVIGSIQTVKPAELKTPSSNLTTSLAGRMAGVIAYQRSGEPGKDNANFFIRGVTTFGYKKDPLILLDNVEVSSDDLARVQPDDIASFSVLKDSASIKVYGKRGANGVILVNTQRGSKTKIQNKEISFSQKTTSTDAVPDFPVSGTVVDEQGRPKAGVSIIVPNTNHGTITDINGHFSLKAMKDGNLWFSFIGYKPVKASVSSTMNIRMEQEVVDLFPELSGSVKNGNSGFKVNNGVTVHGIKGEEPLVIIDGKEAMEKDALSKLAPDHIKSISVLKDKSAQVVYGDKGKNGVIIVEMLTDDEYQARQNKR